jgi:hypothetical protein
VDARAAIAQIAPPAGDCGLAAKIAFLKGAWTPDQSASVLCFREATALNPQYYKAWYEWGWAAATVFEQDCTDDASAVDAIRAFIQCLRLRPHTSFPELLEIIALIFGGRLRHENADRACEWLMHVEPALLLTMLPQLLAKFEENNFIARIVSDLLRDHFHVLVYPLLMREPAATGLLNIFAVTNPVAFSEARTVRGGLLNCASPLFDRWLNWIRKLKRRCDTDAVIAAMGEELDRVSDSETERQFYERYRLDLIPLVNEAREGRGIQTLIACKSRLALISLSYFAPQLFEQKEWILAVPGTYALDTKVVTISHFAPSISIVNRQRKVDIIGSDGKKYPLELKCQSDLRIDQSVLQFFELTNMHIKNRFPKDLRSLNIHCYPITPLSKRAGLVQFVPETESMKAMIRSYRTTQNPELRHAQKLYHPHLNKLTHLQRLEFNLDASAAIPGTDLREAIWLRTGSSQAWLTKTHRFARTVAITSIVGYLIGLGNRRPSNILIASRTGDVVHVDVGTCFEAAAKRLWMPEAVPFRLTRMMISAFGASGIEREFRTTAELTVKLVREHQESTMAALEIFRYDRTFVAGDRLEMIGENDSIVRLDVESALECVRRKVAGMDNRDGRVSSAEEQVAALINAAIDEVNIAKMPTSWCPLW